MIVFIITIVILVVIIVGLIIYLRYVETTLISPSECPRVKGDFTVKPFHSGTALSNCGSDGATLCSFAGITSLEMAIERCNTESCTVFSYDENADTMLILNPRIEILPGGSSDVYLRQTDVAV